MSGWELVGFGIMIALLLYGWPRLFSITINKHYSKCDHKEDDERE